MDTHVIKCWTTLSLHIPSPCEISGFRRGVVGVFALLDFYPAFVGSLPTFRDSLSVNLILHSRLLLGLRCGLFPSDFLTKLGYAFLVFTNSAVYSAIYNILVNWVYDQNVLSCFLMDWNWETNVWEVLSPLKKAVSICTTYFKIKNTTCFTDSM
jgi:hypothetical protein